MRKKLRILLVEDSEVDAMMIDRFLMKNGFSFTIDQVLNIEEYKKALDQENWDIIISDYYLPTFNGLQALQILQQTEKDIPFIIISGLIGEETAVELMRSGARDYLMKDNLKRLPSVINREIREAKSRRARYKDHTELVASNSLNKAILQALPDLVFLLDRYGEFVRIISPGCFQDIFTTNNLSSVDCFNLFFSQTNRPELYNKIQKVIEHQKVDIFEQDIQIGKQRYAFEFRISAIDQRTVLVIIRDTSEQNKTKENLIYNAYHDSLTGLANRKLLNERIQLACDRLKRSSTFAFGVLYLDFDRFKWINDTLGHHIGDLVLIHIANIIRKSVRTIDLPARLGGDEFVILLEDVQSLQDVIDAAKRIIDSFQAEFPIEAHLIQTTPSIGIIFEQGSNREHTHILRNADIAMYEAKRRGGNTYSIYSSDMYDAAINRIYLERDLRKGLRKQEFTLFYQPIIKLQNLQCVGFEALIRWSHPSKGLIAPRQFLDIAEESNLIEDIDQWVVQTACQYWKDWTSNQTDTVPLKLSINLSIRSLNNPRFFQSIEKILNKIGIDPSCLNFEITESLLIKNFETSVKLFQLFKSIGITISLDDFGTGYSALSYLPILPIDHLKIDKYFTQKMAPNNRHYNIIESIITMGQKLEMQVTAEGIEYSEQLEMLQALGCHNGQGFLFSQPIPTHQITEMSTEFVSSCLRKQA